MKTITIGTKITFNATGDKYSIIDRTETGFQFKPIKFEKGLPTVPRTFEEVKDEFLSSQIDIEGFEHNETDNCLVELLMTIDIKDIAIRNLNNNLNNNINKSENIISEKDKKITSQEATIKEQLNSIAAKEKEISDLNSKYAANKNNWQALEEQYKATIEGLEAMAD